MKQAIITTVILICSILTFAQIDSNYYPESDFKVNKFGKLISNVQPNMPSGFDAYGKSLTIKLDSVSFSDSGADIFWDYYYYNPNGSLKYSTTTMVGLNNTYSKKKYYYNSYGLLARSEEFLTEITSSTLIDSIKIYYKYNTDSLLIKKTQLELIGNTFDTTYANEYLYDNNGKLITRTEYIQFQGNSFLQKSNESYYYFSNNTLDSFYYYDPSLFGDWYSSIRDYYSYNSLNQRISETECVGVINDTTSMHVYEYKNNGLMDNTIQWYFNSYMVDNDIMPFLKVNYMYDMDFNNISMESFINVSFGPDTLQPIVWEITHLDSILYNPNTLMSNIVYPSILGANVFGNTNSPKEYKKYAVNSNDELYLSQSKEYFYSNFYLGINSQTKEKIEVNISPNPFKESFAIKSDNLDKVKRINIYNVVGELIKSEIIKSNEKVINLPNVAPGVYFIRILDKNNSILATKKIIKI